MSLMRIDVTKRATTIYLGVQGENDAEGVEFDISTWIEEYGAGLAYMYIRRQGDEATYFKTLPIVEGVAKWLFDAADTARSGEGQAQLLYVVDEVVKKTEVFITTTDRSMDQGPGPDPYADYLETARRIQAETMNSATRAAGSEASAAEKVTQAAQQVVAAAAQAAAAVQAAQEAAQYAAQAASVFHVAGNAVFAVNPDNSVSLIFTEEE
jgi:hypothetical protein